MNYIAKAALEEINERSKREKLWHVVVPIEMHAGLEEKMAEANATMIDLGYSSKVVDVGGYFNGGVKIKTLSVKPKFL